MIKHILPLALAATLAACNNSDHDIVVGGPDYDSEINRDEQANLVLPPSIAASKIYRCADNEIVYVDWLSDGKSANIRTEKGGHATMVSASEDGQPLTAEGGYSLSGTASDSSARIALPGHPAQSCKA